MAMDRYAKTAPPAPDRITKTMDNGDLIYMDLAITGPTLEEYIRLQLEHLKEQKAGIGNHHNGSEHHTLPPTRQRGLVANDHYTAYTTTGNKVVVKDRPTDTMSDGPKSLPNSGSKKMVEASPRQATSAPNRKRGKHHQPPAALPKINSLVQGHYKQIYPRQVAPVHVVQDHAGVPTKTHTEHLSRKEKFSNWANARVEQSSLSREGSLSDDRKADGHSSPNASNDKTKTDNKVSPRVQPEPRTQKRQEKPEHKYSFHASESAKPSDEVAESKTATQQQTDPKTVQNSNVNNKQNETVAENTPRPRLEPKPRPEKSILRNNTYYRTRTQYSIGSQKNSSKALQRKQSVYPDNEEDPEKVKLHREVYGISQIRRIYAGKSTLSHKDLHSRRTSRSGKSLASGSAYSNQTSSIPPWRKGEYVLTKNQVDSYKRTHAVYGNTIEKKRRHNQFYKKLEEAQVEGIKRHNQEVVGQKLKQLEAKQRQERQLRRVRQKFEDEQGRRFRTQYVTHRILQHEWVDRVNYGLPDTKSENEDRTETRQSSRTNKKHKKPLTSYNPYLQRDRNTKRYNTILNMKVGPNYDKNTKKPKMEGIDTVELEGVDSKGQKTTKVMDVQDLLADARKVLQQKEADSPRRTKQPTKESKPAERENKPVAKDKKPNVKPSKAYAPQPPSKPKANQQSKTATGAKQQPKKKEKDDDNQDRHSDVDSIDLDNLDLDDDDDDVWEKARKKYNINLDSDEEN